jgi:hypothetical protein
MRTLHIPLLVVVAALAAAALPSSASAACAKVPFKDLVNGASVVATVEFQAGDPGDYGELRTPAAAGVRVYDQGSGPQQLKVSTALGAVAFGSEGIRPKTGELWRLYGAISPNGSFGTSICAGSVLMPAQAATASLTLAGKSTPLAPASIAGRPHSGVLPVVKLPRSGTAKLRASSHALDAAAAQSVAACLVEPGHAVRTLKIKWKGRSSAMSGKLPKLKLGKKGATLVVVTRDASFAIALRRPA